MHLRSAHIMHLTAMFSFFLIFAAPVFSQTETLIYSFGGYAGDGTNPVAGLTLDKQGNLYGTTSSGGANGWGTVFKLTPAGTESVVYSFAGPLGDGAFPFAAAVLRPASPVGLEATAR